MDDYIGLQRETIISADEYVKKVIPGIDAIIKDFREENGNEGLQKCLHLSEGLQWMIDALSLTKDLQGKCNTEINSDGIVSVLKLISELVIEDNRTTLIKLLESELKPVILHCNEQINVMMENSNFLSLSH